MDITGPGSSIPFIRVPLEDLSTETVLSQQPAAEELRLRPMGRRHRQAHRARGRQHRRAIATTSSGGLDFKAMLQYARETGGPPLRKMTFPSGAAC